MKISSSKLFSLHAEFCKVLANPKRLMIIALLSKREMSVGELAAATEVPLTTISQQLRVLRERNVVSTHKVGQTVYCSLTDPRLMEACVRIRTILLDNMRQRGTLAQEIDPEGVLDE
jgi:ArsR family transcriptional regulator